MKGGTTDKKSITPQQAVKILERSGLKVNEQEAEKILDTLYLLAKLTVSQEIKLQEDKNQ